jgi:hypothetical protein
MSIRTMRWVFAIAAIYDGVLGLALLLWTRWVFTMFSVTPPNHMGYVQFPAFLLLVFAAMFIRVARDPIANRFLMLCGVALKVGYCSIVFYYALTSGVPVMWMPWAWADLLFLVLFLWSWNQAGRASSGNP